MLIYSLLSQKIVVATGILFNISRMWKDEGPEDDSDSEESGDKERGNSLLQYKRGPRICPDKGTGGAREAKR